MPSSSSSSSTTLTNLLVPTYKQSIKTLSAWLDKAGSEELLSKRLAPDMLPLATQIRFVCLQAQEAVYRLQNKEISQSVLDLAEESRQFGKEGAIGDTFVDAKARINETLRFLDTLEANALDLDGSAERMLALELPGSLNFDLTGEQYARDWALPQFYFHMVTAYSILRNAGVDLGKADYVPHMFAYLRPPAPPAKAQEES